MSGKIFIGTRIRDLSNTWTNTNTAAYSNNQSNVGIGTSNPQSALDVVGDISVNCLAVLQYPASANYNNWTKNSNIISSTLNVGINKTNPSSELDISGGLQISTTSSQANSTQTIGTRVVSNLSSTNSLTHYGNLNVYNPLVNGISTDSNIEVSGNIFASKYLVVNNDTTEQDFFIRDDVEISGNVFVDGALMDAFTPLALRTVGLVSTDNTALGTNNFNKFMYIDKMGVLVGNQIRVIVAGTTIYNDSLGNTSTRRRSFLLPSGVNERVVKVYSNLQQTFVLTDANKAYAIGYNADGNCGIYNEIASIINSFTQCFTRDVSGNPITGTIKKFITGTHMLYLNFALTEQGDLYGTGYNHVGTLANGTLSSSTNSFTNKGPNLVNFSGFATPPRGYVKDALLSGTIKSGGGFNSTLCVLDNSGFVWTAGNSIYGQNGRGGTSGTTVRNTVLVKVQTSSTADLSNITSIYEYGKDDWEGFFAIHQTGDLYAWGRNTANLLLDGTSSDLMFAKRINSSIPTSPLIRKVWTARQDLGDFFVQSTTGLIFGTGYGFNLGIGATNRSGWTQITHFNTDTKRVVEMYPLQGSDYSQMSYFAITRNIYTDVYTLWGTGDNTTGQLGLGDTTDRNVWCNVGLHSDIVRNIRNITGSGYTGANTAYTVILLNNGYVLFSGANIPFYNKNTVNDTRFRLLF
jgi:alpha-tubulin suppressor-like RCC1 family protein